MSMIHPVYWDSGRLRHSYIYTFILYHNILYYTVHASCNTILVNILYLFYQHISTYNILTCEMFSQIVCA